MAKSSSQVPVLIACMTCDLWFQSLPVQAGAGAADPGPVRQNQLHRSLFLTFLSFPVLFCGGGYMHIYIYIYLCVCVLQFQS